jgi:CrcB protein
MADEVARPVSRVVLCAAVATGSAIGALSRYFSASAIADLWGGGDLLATAVVNVVGSFVIGLYATLTSERGIFPASELSRQFVMAGFCGGYTTRSLMGLNTFLIILDHHPWHGAGYVVGVVGLSLLAVAAGYAIGRMFCRRTPPAPVDECHALS